MPPKTMSMPTIDTTSFAILQTFIDGPAFGLIVAERAEAAGIDINIGNIYPRLRAMERDGLLESWDGETTPERAGRPRRYYKLTVVARLLLLADRAEELRVASIALQEKT